MKQKKLMLLGGIRYLLPVIKAAHEQGYYVITADYLPDNIAHQYSDEYIIDIIMNFAYSNFYEIDEEYLLLKLEKLLQGGTDDDRTGI